MFNLGTAIARMILDASGLRRGLNQARSDLATFDKSIKANQYGVIAASRAYAVMAGAAVAGFGLAAKAAIEWEDALAGVRRTTQATDGELQSISKGLRDIAATKPIKPLELASVAEEAGALGIATKNVVAFTSVVADLVAATELTADEASSGLARLTGIMGDSAAEFNNVGGTILELGRKTKATDAEILNMSRRIAGVGKVVGLSTDQVLAYAAALASVGVREEQGGSAISRQFIDILDAVNEGGKALQNYANIADMSAEQFASAFRDDAARATQEFIEGIGRIGDQAIPALNALGITEVRQRDAITRLAAATQNYGDVHAQLGNVLDIGAAAMQEESLLQTVAAQRYNTTAAQLTILRNLVSEFAASVGSAMLPVVRGLVEVFQGLGQALNNLSPQWRSMILVTGGLIAVLGVLGVVLLSTSVAALHFSRAMATATGMTSLFGRTAGFLLRSTGLLAGGLILGAGALALFGDRSRKVEKSTLDAVKANEALLASMEKGQAAVTAWTNQQVRQVVASGQNAAALRRLGLTQAHLTSVIQGSYASQQAFLEAVKRRPDDKGVQRLAGAVAKVREEYKATALQYDVTKASLEEHTVAVEQDTKAIKSRNKAMQEGWDLANAQNQALLDLVDAEFSQRAALFALEDAQKEYEDALEGSKERVDDIADSEDNLADARDKLAESLENLAEAEEEFADARQKAARALAKAEDKLADAQDDRLDNQDKIYELERKLQKMRSVDGLRAIADATRDLTRAQLGLKEANRDVSDSEFYLQYLRERGASARDIADAEFALEKSRADQQDASAKVVDTEEELQYLRDGGAAREVAAAERDLEKARRDSNAALREISEAERELNDARKAVESDSAHITAQRELESARRDVASAVRDIRDAERELREERSNDPSSDAARAAFDLEQAYYRVAEANVEVRKQTALMRGESWDAGRQARELGAELLAMAGTVDGEVSRRLLAASARLAQGRPLGKRPESDTGVTEEQPVLPEFGGVEDPFGAGQGPFDADDMAGDFGKEFGGALTDVNWKDILKPVAAVIAGQLIYTVAKAMIVRTVLPAVVAFVSALAAGFGISVGMLLLGVTVVGLLIAGIVAALWKSGIGEKILGGLVDAVKASINWFKENWKAVVAGAIIAALFGIPGLLAIALINWGPEIFGAIVGAIESAIGFLQDNWERVLLAALTGGLSEIVIAMVKYGPDIVEGLWNGIKAGAKYIANFAKWLWGILVDGFKRLFGINSPSTVFFGLGGDIIRGLWDGIVFIFEQFIRFWTMVPGRIVGFFLDAAQWLVNAGRNVVSGLLNGVKNFWTDTLSPFFGGLKDKILGFFTGAGSWLWDAGKNVMEGLKNGILGAVGGVANAIRKPLNWGIEKVANKFISGVESFANAVPGISIKLGRIPELPTFQFHEGGTVGKGGKRRNPKKRLRRGEVPAVLLEGEHVLNRKEAKQYKKLGLENAIGGWGLPNPISWGLDLAGDVASSVIGGARKVAAAVARPVINGVMKLIDVGLTPFGGIGKMGGGMLRNLGETFLDWIAGVDKKSPLEEMAAAGPTGAGVDSIGKGISALKNYMLKSGVPYVVTSTLRPGDPGRHGQGKAVDFSIGGHGNRGFKDPGLRGIFNYLLRAQGSLYELILAGAPFNIKRGKRVPGYAWGRPGSPGNHWNHVHAATFDSGGTLLPGWNMVRNATGRNEHVIPTELMFRELERILTAAMTNAIEPLREALAGQRGAGLSTLDLARYAAPVASQAAYAAVQQAVAAQTTSNRGGDTINIPVKTDADPLEIANEIVWQKRTRFR